MTLDDCVRSEPIVSMRGLRFVSCIWLAAVFIAVPNRPVVGQEKSVDSQSYRQINNLAYRNSDDELISKKCRLDLYHPVKPGFATVVWFHGGGLTSGKRSIPKRLQQQKVAVIGVDYRLYPKVTVADCIDDAAASIHWTIKNISKYGGDPSKIFVSGHSAGGYLTSMVGLDKSYLAKYDVDADDLKGLIPFSGHTITHFTQRKSQGIDGKQPIVDKMAPLFHVRDDCPPILFITGDRELEMLGRYEENAYMWRMMKVVGHDQADLMELDGYNHGQMADAGFPLLLRFIKKHASGKTTD